VQFLGYRGPGRIDKKTEVFLRRISPATQHGFGDPGESVLPGGHPAEAVVLARRFSIEQTQPGVRTLFLRSCGSSPPGASHFHRQVV
jgi:hypothetical protein